MTNPSSNTPPNSSNRRNLISRLLQIARHPAAIALGVSSIVFGVLGYTGVRIFIYQKLPSLVETELSRCLKREVRVGEVESFSFAGIRFGSSSIPATPADPDRLSIQAVEIGFNPLPLLIRRPLPVNMTAVSPDIYVEQDRGGKWLDLDWKQEKGCELPVDIDATVRIEEAKIVLLPQEGAVPLTVQINGKGRYIQTEHQQLQYDIDAAILNSKIKIEGETAIETGQSYIKLVVKNLALAKLTSLIPNFPVELNRGELNTNLNLELPSFEEIASTRGKGQLSISNIEARAQQLKEPLIASARVQFQGRKIRVEEAKANLGEIAVLVGGEVDWEKGFDLDVRVMPFSLANLLETVPVSLPMAIDGQMQAKLQLVGPVTEPLLTGTLKSTKNVRIDKIEFKEISTNFQADLEKFVLKSLRVVPAAGGQITGTGIVETGLRQSLAEKKARDWMAMPLSLNFRAQLPTEALAAPYYPFPSEIKVGAIAAQAQVRGTLENPQASLKWQAPLASASSEIGISGAGEVLLSGKNLILRNTEFQTGGGKIYLRGSGNLKSQKWQTFLTANAISLDPFLSAICKGATVSCFDLSASGPITLNNANVRLSGKLDSFDSSNIEGVANLALRLGGGTALLSSQLSQGVLEASVAANRISLTPFVPSLPVPVALTRSQVKVSGSLEQLFDGLTPVEARGFAPLRSFKATADLQLAIADGTAKATGQLNNGVLEASASASQIPVTELIPNLPFPVELLGTQVSLSGNLEQLWLSLGSTPDLKSFKATADMQLAVANGTVNATSEVNYGLWQTEIAASGIDSSLVIGKGQMTLPDLNATLNLSGKLASIFQPNTPIAIQGKALSVQLGEQFLDARGKLFLSNLTTVPDISRLELDIQARSDLKTLPLTELLVLVPVERRFLPEKINLTGKGNFQGRLLGKNLLSAPGNFTLTGNLRLSNFTLNNRAFAPVLAGPVKLAPAEKLAIDLRGKDDLIAAVLESCTGKQCRLPYLPASFTFRQGEGSENPVIVLGKRQGDLRFVADIQNFPLELFNIAPAAELGIPGTVTGEVTAKLDVNLFTLATAGNVQIKQPGIGYIKAETFAASFSYQNDLAQLTSASLKLGKSRYDGEARLNLKSGEVNGKLNITRGYVEDILNALQWWSFESITSFFQFKRRDLAGAAEVQPKPVGDSDAPLSDQVNLLSEIDRKLEALAAEMLAGEGSTQLDIQGAYTADVTVAGTWKEPQVNFKFEGNDWKWHPQKAFPAIVKPLGLVMEELQVIPVEQVLVQGGYEDGTIKVEPARVRIGDTVLAFAGNLSPQESEQNSEFIVENLSLDLVRYFVEIPFDIAGNINAKGSLGGSLANPQVKGEFAFVEGAVNAKAIDEAIAGNFSYADSLLEFRTTSPESIQVYASVPYPPQPEVNDRVKVNIKLGTEAIALLGAFTQGQLEWIDGEGEVTLNGSGRLDLNEQVRLSDVAVEGKIDLWEAALKSAASPEVLKVNGQIALNNQLLKVEQLEGTIANSKLSVTGILPLFQPLGQSNSSNPLTIAIEQGEMELEGLYKGGIDGKVVITGAAIAPAIGGEIRLQNGRAFLPEEKATNVEEVSAAFYKWSGLIAGKTGAAVVPRLNNFRVVLDGLGIEQDGLLFFSLFKFSFAGALTLNGALDNLDNLQPEGTIRLERGEIDLGTTQLFLAHRYDNRIDFVPQRGLFNPNLDIQLKTFLFNVSLVSVNRNEVRDDIVKSGRAKTIELTVTIDGKVNDLLPSLGKEVSEVCQIKPDNISPIPEQTGFSPAEFQQLVTCIETSVFESAIEDKSELQLLQQLLFVPIVEIDSSPTLSLSEIIVLFGKQLASQFESKFPFLVESLQEQNQEQLLEFGVTQVLIGPLLQRFGFEANEAVNSVVEKFGLKDFRVFPIVEAIYQVDGESFVGISYDYNFNEVKVRYEIEF